jgi:hypothetical protein
MSAALITGNQTAFSELASGTTDQAKVIIKPKW